MRVVAYIVVLLCCLGGYAQAANIAFPALTGRVVDDAHLLSADNIRAMEARLAEHERATGNQVVVVTLPSLQNIPIEEYGYQLGRFWGIGQKGKNNGALLIVAPKERAVRIEVGYGLEGVLTDALSHIIINRIILPQFKAGDYNAGIVQGTAAILTLLEGKDVSINGMQAPSPEKIEDHEGIAQSIMPIILILIIFFIIPMMRGRRRHYGVPFIFTGSNWGGGGGGGFSGGGGSFGGGGASGRW